MLFTGRDDLPQTPSTTVEDNSSLSVWILRVLYCGVSIAWALEEAGGEKREEEDLGDQV